MGYWVLCLYIVKDVINVFSVFRHSWLYIVCVCVCAAAMEELVCELRLFLDLLDREYLSAGVRERKMHISNILHRVLSEKGELAVT